MTKRWIGPSDLSTPEKYQNETPNIQRIKKKHPEHTTHTDEKRFKSEISKGDFVAPSSSHMKTHTSEEPLSCLEYTMNFTREKYLKEHMRTNAGKRCSSVRNVR
ncbi:hypothetical protein LOAG_14265 [Loa loa]|uniref:Zinc finger protein n=1 Tax=Loa loa TaxID=7209 RepID=A0A1S0THW7_LOALO|nr:hypothetical protein LOAG_14265 [Loa loa]EFO14259.1 hypothetical protein LOAG_14265 [Loa loa]